MFHLVVNVGETDVPFSLARTSYRKHICWIISMIVNYYPIRNAQESTRMNSHRRIFRSEGQKHVELIYIYSLRTLQEHIHIHLPYQRTKNIIYGHLSSHTGHVQERKILHNMKFQAYTLSKERKTDLKNALKYFTTKHTVLLFWF